MLRNLRSFRGHLWGIYRLFVVGCRRGRVAQGYIAVCPIRAIFDGATGGVETSRVALLRSRGNQEPDEQPSPVSSVLDTCMPLGARMCWGPFFKRIIRLVGRLALVDTVVALAFVVATPCSFASVLSKVRPGSIFLYRKSFPPVGFCHASYVELIGLYSAHIEVRLIVIQRTWVYCKLRAYVALCYLTICNSSAERVVPTRRRMV